MLVIGRGKAEQAQAQQVTFVEADAQHLPFPDNAFQIVSVAFGLRNVTDTDRGLREMVRVCRPGGKIAVLEFSMPRWQPFKAIYQWYFRHVLPRIGQAVRATPKALIITCPKASASFPPARPWPNACARPAPATCDTIPLRWAWPLCT